MDIITVAVCVLWFKEGASVYPEGVQEEEGAEEGSEDENGSKEEQKRKYREMMEKEARGG